MKRTLDKFKKDMYIIWLYGSRQNQAKTHYPRKITWSSCWEDYVNNKRAYNAIQSAFNALQSSKLIKKYAHIKELKLIQWEKSIHNSHFLQSLYKATKWEEERDKPRCIMFKHCLSFCAYLKLRRRTLSVFNQLTKRERVIKFYICLHTIIIFRGLQRDQLLTI